MLGTDLCWVRLRQSSAHKWAGTEGRAAHMTAGGGSAGGLSAADTDSGERGVSDEAIDAEMEGGEAGEEAAPEETGIDSVVIPVKRGAQLQSGYLLDRETGIVYHRNKDGSRGDRFLCSAAKLAQSRIASALLQAAQLEKDLRALAISARVAITIVRGPTKGGAAGRRTEGSGRTHFTDEPAADATCCDAGKALVSTLLLHDATQRARARCTKARSTTRMFPLLFLCARLLVCRAYSFLCWLLCVQIVASAKAVRDEAEAQARAAAASEGAQQPVPTAEPRLKPTAAAGKADKTLKSSRAQHVLSMLTAINPGFIHSHVMHVKVGNPWVRGQSALSAQPACIVLLVAQVRVFHATDACVTVQACGEACSVCKLHKSCDEEKPDGPFTWAERLTWPAAVRFLIEGVRNPVLQRVLQRIAMFLEYHY